MTIFTGFSLPGGVECQRPGMSRSVGSGEPRVLLGRRFLLVSIRDGEEAG